MTSTANNPRVRYPNRTVYFGEQTGLIDVKDWANKVERARLKRLGLFIGYDGIKVPFDLMTVESLEQFKERFGL